MKGSPALLMIAASEADANLLFATSFLAGSPFIFLQIDGRKTLVISDLELGRAQAEARVDEILSLTEIERDLKSKGIELPHPADVAYEILCRRGVREVTVPVNFGVELADRLREKGVHLRWKEEPFFEERTIKTAREVEAIEQTQRCAEEALDAAIQLLREASIDGSGILHQGRPVTAELLKRVIAMALIERNCTVKDPIVACGDQGCLPHSRGSGAIIPHQSVVFDLVPCSMETGFYADLSRTVVKGKGSPELKRLYSAVLKAQEHAFSLIRDGTDGREVHAAVRQLLEEMGYTSGLRHGRMEGFFHGTGHGVGLEIHEFPRIGRRGTILRAGNVVTVEPGLYYFGTGAVRIEDMVVVEDKGYRNLTRYPKFLEIL